MPAAAVIPAPIAYIKVVAVKTLVVEVLSVRIGQLLESVLIVADIDPIHPVGQPDGCSELLL